MREEAEQRQPSRPGRLVLYGLGVLGLLSVVALVGSFLALHDIARDYVSPRMIESYLAGAPAGAEALPPWSLCAVEWRMVTLGFLPLLALHVGFFVLLRALAVGARGHRSDR
jgi:hypothetical protein